jgi:prophage regulatory protein
MQEIILRKRDVLAAIGMRPTWLHEAVKRGTFPRPVRLGARAVGWRKSEVESWLKSREVA